MDSFEDLLYGLIFNNYATSDKIGREVVGDYTVSTLETEDQGWETAVWKGHNDMIIVARYPHKRAARAGHRDWCEVCKLNPTSAWSVQTEQYEEF